MLGILPGLQKAHAVDAEFSYGSESQVEILRHLGHPDSKLISAESIFTAMYATSKSLAASANQDLKCGPTRATEAQKARKKLCNRFASERSKHWLRFVDMV